MAATLPGRVGPRERLRTYVELAKPRIVLLLLFTTVTAMFIAVGGVPPVGVLLWTLLGGACAAGGASALNQVIDRDMDARMTRTARRPIPSGRIGASHALAYGLTLLTASGVVLSVFVNPLTALLALLGAAYYVVLYTLLLKRNTALNIVIGGGAGAMPVLVGWAAIAGTLSLEAWVLFGIVFYWTPPHSWALALLVNTDYTRAGVPMMPVARGEATTRRQIVVYTVLLVVITLLPLLLNMLGVVYTLGALLMGAEFIRLALRLWRKADKVMARRLYKYSTAYLALLFLMMLLDRVFPL